MTMEVQIHQSRAGQRQHAPNISNEQGIIQIEQTNPVLPAKGETRQISALAPTNVEWDLSDNMELTCLPVFWADEPLSQWCWHRIIPDDLLAKHRHVQRLMFDAMPASTVETW